MNLKIEFDKVAGSNDFDKRLVAIEIANNARKIIFGDGGCLLAEENDSKIFIFALSIVKFYLQFGRKEKEAQTLFSAVLQYHSNVVGAVEQGNVRFEIIKIFIERGLTRQAVEMVDTLSSPVYKFNALIDIAAAYQNQGKSFLAQITLETLCSPLAEESQADPNNRLLHARQLIAIAGVYIELGQKETAEKILERAAKNLSNKVLHDIGLLQDLASLLLKIDREEKALDLLTKGWTMADFDSAAKKRSRQLEIVRLFFKKFAAELERDR